MEAFTYTHRCFNLNRYPQKQFAFIQVQISIYANILGLNVLMDAVCKHTLQLNYSNFNYCKSLDRYVPGLNQNMGHISRPLIYQQTTKRSFCIRSYHYTNLILIKNNVHIIFSYNLPILGGFALGYIFLGENQFRLR